MNRVQLLQNLTGKINDSSYERIAATFPVFSKCPTCNDEGAYTLEGKKHTCDCEIQKLLLRSYLAANIPREYHDICLEHFFGEDKASVLPQVIDYIENFDNHYHYGLGLTFAGPYGTGKSFLVASILKEIVKQGRSAYFITFDEFVQHFGATWNDETSKKLMQDTLKRVEILGLDELKVDERNANGFLADALQSIIRHRTSNLLPTLITTNLTPDKQEVHFAKAHSLLSAKNTFVLTAGKDVRPTVKSIAEELVERNERRPIC